LGAADTHGAICGGRAHGTDRGYLSAGTEPDRLPRNLDGDATGPGAAAPAAALAYSSAFVAPLLVWAPATLALYGKPYDSQLTVYALLLGVQWANGVGRPAVRHAVVEWNARQIGLTVGSGAVAVVLICALGVTAYGALAAAVASLIGALIVNGRAIGMALSRPE